MTLKTLSDLLQQDRRHSDSILTEEQFRYVLTEAVPVFKQSTIRAAFPTTVINDPGVIKSRHIKVVDMGGAQHGMAGTGGLFDRADQTSADIMAYAIWKNIEVPWREQQTSERSGFNVLRESAQLGAQTLVETENKMLINGLGPNKGLTNTTGIQTFASAGAWTTAGIAYQDITKAIGKLLDKKVPMGQYALGVSALDYVNLLQTFSNTDSAQLDKIAALLPGGVYASPEFATGKAYLYAKTPTCVEYRVYQDLSVIPLPKVDEDERLRLRVIGALHVKQADAVCEITSVDV